MRAELSTEHGYLFGKNPELALRTSKNLDAIVDLLGSWCDKDGTVRQIASPIPAGFTYFAQFFVHDVTSRPGISCQTPAFDLQSLYGVAESPGLVNGVFPLGHTTPRNDRQTSRPLDLFRINRIAQIGEPRNDENLLLAQFHLLVQRFHNAVYRRAGHTDELAVEVVKYCLQQILLQDYLPRICDPDVLGRCHGIDMLHLSQSETMPHELAGAVLRFGHSMVRNDYKLNSAVPEPLELLLKLTAAGGFIDRGVYPTLPDDRVIDWELFIDSPSGKAQGALIIDPNIADRLLFVARKIVMRGVQLQLTSGQQVVAALAECSAVRDAGINLTSQVMPGAGHPMFEKLLAAEVLEETPLWLYLLLEALHQHNGNRLGTLGSLLFYQTAKAAVQLARPGVSSERVRQLLGEEVSSLASLLQFVMHAEACG